MTVDYRLDMYYIQYPLTFLCNRGRPDHDGMVVSQCLSLTFWVRIPICDSNCLPFRSTCVHPKSYLSGVPVFTLDVYYMYMLYHSTVLCYRAVLAAIVWCSYLQIHLQSVPITTNVVSSNPAAWGRNWLAFLLLC